MWSLINLKVYFYSFYKEEWSTTISILSSSCNLEKDSLILISPLEKDRYTIICIKK